MLAWNLQQDPRLEVRKRSNAMHAERTKDGVDQVDLDLGWTQQRQALLTAQSWLSAGRRIVSLVKPPYELNQTQPREHLNDGQLGDEVAENMLQAVLDSLDGLGLHCREHHYLAHWRPKK
jgi:predicted rRNA methylase YqxC with S4 and FtsJ domains